MSLLIAQACRLHTPPVPHSPPCPRGFPMRSSVELQMCQLSTFRLPNGISIPHFISTLHFFPISPPFPTLTDATRVLHLGTEWACGRGLPVAWGMLSHLLQFLGHFSYSLSAINAAICKSNPSFPTSLHVLPLSPPPL